MSKSFQKEEIRRIKGGIKMLERAIADPGTTKQERESLRTYRRANSLYLYLLTEDQKGLAAGDNTTVLSESNTPHVTAIDNQIADLKRKRTKLYDSRSKATRSFNRNIQQISQRIEELRDQRSQ